MKRANIKTNTIYNIIKAVSSVIFPLISFPYVSRVLLPEGVGKVNFANSVINYFALIASLGLTTYAIRECSRVREDKEKLSQTASELFSVNAVTTLVSYGLLVLTLLFARPLDNYRLLIVVQSTVIVFISLGADWLNSAMEDFRYITLRTVAFQMLSLTLMFLFVKSPDDYLIYSLIMVLSQSGSHIANIFYRRRYCRVRLIRNMKFKQHIKPVLLLFAMQLSQVIFTNADTTMLGLIHTDREVGLYSTAVKIYTIINQLVSSILWVVLPRLSLNYAKRDYTLINPLLRKILGFYLALTLPCIAGLNMLSKEVVELIGGVDYQEAAPVLQILTVSLFFSIFGGGFIGNIIMLPSMREKYFLLACSIAAVANVVLNAFLIPSMGIYGAAITTVISSILIFVILLPRIEKEIDLGNLWKLSGAPILGSLMIVAVCLITRHFFNGLWPRTIISILASIAVYGITLLLCRYELIVPIFNELLRKLKKVY